MAASYQKPATTPAKTILLVEDEAIIALKESAVLKKYGFAVMTVHSAGKAVRAVSEHTIDLILMDIDLGEGEMDGTQAAEQILRDHQLPIVFVTSHSEQEMVEKVKGITRYGYVLKNAGEFVLIEAITMAFELFRSFLAIQDKERQLELAMDAEDHAYWDLNLDTGQTYFSPRYFHMLGYEPGELPMHIDTWKELLHPEDKKNVYPEIMKKVEEFAPFKYEFRLRTKNGRWKWIKGSGKTYQEERGGSPRRVVGTHEDITERRRAEESLRESERQLHTLMGNLPGMAYRCLNDQYWTMEFVSDGCRALTGYSASELTGNDSISYARIIHPDDRGFVWEQIQQKLAVHSSFEIEYRIVTKDSLVKYVWERGTGVYEAERLRFLEGFITDITKHKEIVQYLEGSEQKFQYLIENLDDIIYTIDMETEEFTFVSPAFERVLGYTLGDVEAMGGRKQFLSKVIQYGAFQEQLRALAEFAGGNAQRLRHISVWKAKDGTPKTLEDYWVPVFENGTLRTVHGVLRDITDRKRAEDALQESQDKYKRLVDNLPFAVFELDSRGNIITLNTAIAEYIGVQPDEAAKKNMQDFFQIGRAHV
mgnify:FL=1